MPGGDKKETEEEKKERIKKELKEGGKKYTIKIPEEKITAKRDNLRIAEKPWVEIKLTAKGGNVISPIKVSDKKCFCHRDFTVEELKNIIKDLRLINNDKRTDLFYLKSSISINHDLKEIDKSYEVFTKELNLMFKKYNITTCLRKTHFLAQAAAESRVFNLTEENDYGQKGYLQKKPYFPYIGRGILQLTHSGE